MLWIAVKATQLDSAVGVIGDGNKLGAIVPLLNGVDHVERLRSRFGQERVVAATIRVESERVSPGKIVHRSPFVRLSLSAVGQIRLQPVVEKLRQFGFNCEFVEDEATLLWSKLVFIAPFALVTTAAGMTKGEVAGDPVWRKRFEACVVEACEVAAARGAKVDAAAVIAFFDGLPAEMRSSMQKDVAAGDVPELEAIAGPILSGGQEYGFEVAVTRELVESIRRKLRAGDKTLGTQEATTSP